ncbi:MAG: RHS repeat-associated core domain-containing protein [Rhodanobacteraceae bacterium]|nr:RHS repeat-associated core domain-containing protein [Rhodanobacteraceae bacterium]
MLACWIATVAALLLACAQACAHVHIERVANLVDLADVTAPLGELAQPSETALPARANPGKTAPSENAALTHCRIWQKSPPLVESTSGTTIWRWDSAPFGDTDANEQPTGGLPRFTFNLRFPGQQYDRETGTHYNYFRDYEAGSGRYVQADPLGLEGSDDLYQYVDSQVIGAIDPDGPKTLALRVRPGWSQAEKDYANAKIKCLKNAARGGRLRKTTPVRTGSAGSHYSAATGKAPAPGQEADHVIDLQLGGCEKCGGNLFSTSRRVNRSFGAQIGNQLRSTPLGTLITRVVRRK